jgi:hypothetical protein
MNIILIGLVIAVIFLFTLILWVIYSKRLGTPYTYDKKYSHTYYYPFYDKRTEKTIWLKKTRSEVCHLKGIWEN